MPDYEYTIDAAVPAGTALNSMRPSSNVGLATAADLAKFDADFRRRGLMRFSLENVLKSSTSGPDFITRMQAAVDGALVGRTEPILLLVARMPHWLSTSSDATIDPNSGWEEREKYPPTNYTTWANILQATVDYVENVKGLRPWYTIWNEPTSTAFWKGTQGDLFTLYRHSVSGAHIARMGSVVGAFALAPYNAAFGGHDECFKEFAVAMHAASVPVTGETPVPIGFLDFHSYGKSVHQHRASTDTVRGWLNDAGYDGSAIPLVLSEWNLGASDAPDLRRDTEYGAAHDATQMLYMQKWGLDRQTRFMLDDFTGSQTLFGSFGAMSRGGSLVKPSYNVMRMLDRFPTALVSAVTNSPLGSAFAQVQVLTATADNGRELAIFVSNFAEGILAGVGVYLTEELGYTGSDFLALGITLAQLGGMLLGTVPITSPPLTAQMVTDLTFLRTVVQARQREQTANLSLRLTLRNIAFKPVRYRRFLVDSTHSNATRIYNARIAAGDSDAAAVAAAQPYQDLEEVERRVFQRPPATLDLTLEPNSVNLLMLTASDLKFNTPFELLR